MALDKGTTIIIKKIKKGRHGHHGGAWKVAYADFVTAMMAFFLLMWLINVSTDEQKEGIADYFMPTFGVKGSVGNEREGGLSAVKKGELDQEKTPPGIIIGQVPQGPIAAKPEQIASVEDVTDSQLFEKAQEQIKQTFEEDPNFRDFKDNIVVEQNPEGLKINLVDSDKFPMFDAGGLQLSQFGMALLTKMSDVIRTLPNHISITGHTDTSSNPRSDGYSNWELSADRANVARRFLMSTQLEKSRVMKVVGMADQDLLLKDNPTSERNRRVTIILLRGSYMDLRAQDQVAPRNLLTVPKPTDTIKAPIIPARREVRPAPRTSIETPNSPVSEPVARTGISSIPGTIEPKATEDNQ
jgi:chemotaxis protein MotB